MNSVILVNFYGDEILCITDDAGTVWIAVRRMCENMGLSRQGQQVKIMGDPKFVWHDIVLHDASGRKQEMFCLRLDHVEGWLMSINANRVKAGVREKLISYQRECMQVLNDYWTKGQAINPRAEETLPVALPIGEEAFTQKLNEILEQVTNKQAQLFSLKIEELESRLRAEHAKRLMDAFEKWVTRDDSSRSVWAFNQLKIYVADELSPYSSFKLYELFLEIYPDRTKEEAQTLAGKFNKLDSVKAFARGHATEQYGDKVYRVVRYERKDWEELRELAITWMREQKFPKQRGLFEQA